jgi:hypothetical protein
MTIHTIKSLRRSRRVLDLRRHAGVAGVIRSMRAGASLHQTFTADGPRWVLSSGQRVPDELAAVLIRHPNVVGCRDSLFGDYLRSQTFRFAE